MSWGGPHTRSCGGWREGAVRACGRAAVRACGGAAHVALVGEQHVLGLEVAVEHHLRVAVVDDTDYLHEDPVSQYLTERDLEQEILLPPRFASW